MTIHAQFSLAYTLLGKAVEHPMPSPSERAHPAQLAFPANPAHYEFGKNTAVMLSNLLREGKLKTTGTKKLVPNGLDDVKKWLDYQKQHKVRCVFLLIRG
jgi:hypothetical protein